MCSPIWRRMRERVGRRPSAGGAVGSGRYGLSMWSGASSTAPALDEREHVLLADPPAASCAGNLAEVDAMLGGDPLDDRGVPAPACGTVRSAGGDGRSPRRRRSRPSAAEPEPFAADAGAVDAVPPSTAIRARTSPTGTVASTGTRISVTTPLTGAGTSVSILSVEISQIVSSAAIGSPTPTRQATTVPSATETPICGIVTSTIVAGSVGEELTARLLDTLDRGQHRLLQRRRERNRYVRRRHSHDGAVQRLEPASRRSPRRPARPPHTWSSPHRRSRPSSSARPSRGSRPRRVAPATAGRAPRSIAPSRSSVASRAV